MPQIFTTIERPDENGDPTEHEVAIEFSSHCTLKASKACWDDPGFAAEYDCIFEHAQFADRFAPKDKLTDAELATVRTWFQSNAADDRIWEAANDNEVA